jgi:hypothetical protein
MWIYVHIKLCVNTLVCNNIATIFYLAKNAKGPTIAALIYVAGSE